RWPAVLIGSGTGCAQVFAAYRRDSGDHVKGWRSVRVVLAGHDYRVFGQCPAFVGVFLAGVRSAEHLPNFQHGGRLNDFLYASGIVDSRQLHENLIVAKPVFLNDWLTYPELVDAITDGFNRLLNGTALQISEVRGL